MTVFRKTWDWSACITAGTLMALSACAPKDTGQAEITKGVRLVEQQNYEKGIRKLTIGLEKNPRSDTAYYYRGFAHAMQEHWQQGLSDMDSALKYNPSYPDAYFMRGRMLLELDQPVQGCTDLEMAAMEGHPLAEKEAQEQGCINADSTVKREVPFGAPVD